MVNMARLCQPRESEIHQVASTGTSGTRLRVTSPTSPLTQRDIDIIPDVEYEFTQPQLCLIVINSMFLYS